MPSSRLVTKPFLAVTAATGAFFVYVGMLVPLLPTFIEDELGGGELGVGLSVAMFAVAAILVRPLIARLVHSHGRRVVMVGGCLIASAAGLLTATVSGLGTLLALRAVAGIGEAALFVAAATLVADLAPDDRRAEAASYFSVAVFAGLGFGPVIGELALGDDRYHIAFAAAAGFAALAAVMSLAVPRHVSRPSTTGPDPSPRAGFARLVHPAAVGPGLVLACGIGAFAVYAAFLPDHAREVGLAGSGALFTAYSVVCLVLRITAARLPERLGARRSVTIALVTIGAALLLLAAVPEVWALWAAALILGVGMAFMYPSLMALTVNRVPAQERPAVISSFTMFFEVGTIAGGLVLGTVAEVFSKRAAFGSAVIVCAFGLWVLRTNVAPADEPTSAPDRPGHSGDHRPVRRPNPAWSPVAGD